VEEAISYITSVFNNYKAAAGVRHFHGRIAEIGPGDSCGIGLMFLAEGCDEVDLLDRFFSPRDERHQQAINRTLVQQFPQLSSLLGDRSYSEASFSKLTRHYGESAAAETFFEAHKGYDTIVSCAVLEHLYDPLRALTAASSALNPGGIMMHQVDCRDHEQFSTHFHELKFLELPAPLYSPLRWGGGPNRIRLSSYVNALHQQGMDCTIYVTGLAGVSEDIGPCRIMRQIAPEIIENSLRYVHEIRPRLAKPFRDMPDDDLMVTSFLMVAQKGYNS